MSDYTEAGRPPDVAAGESIQQGGKGLAKGRLGLLASVVLGISTIAPVYTLTGALGPTVREVGAHLPAVFIVGFLPMLLVALGYRELNSAEPDSGTSFTWSARAFGPMIGWIGGWGLVVATTIVLSNLAGVAVDFFYLFLGQITGNPGLAALADNLLINIVTCCVFIALAVWICCRGMTTTMTVQYGLVALQLLVLVGFAFAAFGETTAPPPLAFDFAWFNPFGVESFSAFAAGLSLSIFIFWGWDVCLTVSEESVGSEEVPGKAATWTVLLILGLYLLTAMGYYGAVPQKFAKVCPRSQTPRYATVCAGVAAGLFYVTMRTLSENVLADTITALGMMICFYYSLTAFACVWYFRSSLFGSLRHLLMRGLCPLVGGVILSVIFVRTAIDSASPDFGSGSHVGGVGLVFVIAGIISVLGIVLMLMSRLRAPAYFLGATLRQHATLPLQD